MDSSQDPLDILVCGDFVPTGRACDLLERGAYSDLFGELAPIVKGTRLAIANLEVPLVAGGSPIAKTGPHINGNEKSAAALAATGFNLVTLANNHIRDFGDDGVLSTLATCRIHGLECVGAGSTLEEARNIYVHEFGGKKVAIVNAAENEWGTTSGLTPGANPINPVSLYHSVRDALRLADFVLVILHGGHENYNLPSPRMKQLYRFLIDIGADAVIGHHTHCFSGFETYQGKPIVYSLGNCVYDRGEGQGGVSPWHIGCAAHFSLRSSGSDFKLIPFIQWQPNVPGIALLRDQKLYDFQLQSDRLTAIIQDDAALERRFDEFVRSRERSYRSYIEPTANRWLLAAMNRGLLPRFIRSRQKLYLMNLVRCESHRDILLKVLEK